MDTQITRAARTRVAATAAVLAGAALTLAGCGGGGADGDYIVERNDWKGVLSIDGSDVTYLNFECEDNATEPTYDHEYAATGTLSDDETQVMWTGDDNHIVNVDLDPATPISITEHGDQSQGHIFTDDREVYFTSADEEAIQAAFTERCS